MRLKAGLVVGGLVLALGLTGCSGTSGSPNAKASAKAAGLKYSQCMRKNGVKNFPDPTVDDNGNISYDVPKNIPESVLNPAEKKCYKLRPWGKPGADATDPARMAKLRKHAKCMRKNGFPDWPDPEADGSVRVDFKKLGISGPDDPKLKAAEEKCRNLMPDPPKGGK